ncbi:putative P-loop containing nucleoside triphosphate hydrolase, leucine-rich repeat domain, L [Rosa chinensis]|uniref:Putative P-loop containing nucleoside triphosphate hydrolase, leucine-rich repeat domain, L n=1 Tax=Rosa chinensis TaxID=74649 RepID=A0A2P6RVX3_ROSCH|nr:putative disease resistance protein RGA3 [Rosa chinensis]XP_024179765.1 putative disease resistance protein RGA3 [Rosa chinensis]XP_024179766.1 putative disease resistance protein RGA3 [Rosa chinensis]XP_024179767.1 putative disease resistance protein RGA3 [Rosa chinensis]XP_024179768.1 putative disease resistance protein RGA3 [Rosa chinensis]XP_024179769.1 putative disease resistance protein RGA3 [Rosa chinensis]XP_024179770.1 putative disease resistance protein RGA3 [Rosa chinensis]XP_0
MAEAFVSVLLEQLASITYQQIEKEVRLVAEVEKEVADITSNLKAIQAVLEDAEKRQVKEAIVRDWLEKLKDVSYEMDDVLDEWTTEILIQQVDHLKKVCFFVPSNCFCFGQVNRVIRRRDIARRIQDLSHRLNEIARERQSYNFLNTERVFEQLERIETSSLIDLSKTFGREDETELVVGKLVGESSQEERNPLVIPIVGMGGMGKTTLAQIVYNNEKVKLNFTKRVWVCVSDPFSEVKIAKAIIADLNKDDAPNSNDLQPLLKCIQRNIKGQKFLLVLDDVWTDDDRKWEQLKLSLQSGLVGSRILVTTRKEEVAMMMGVTSANMIHLEKLSEQCCWSIFYHIALAERERDESKVLESLGKDIVKRCKGLPLLAKVLGGLMRSKKTKKEWQDVLSSKIWGLDKVEQQVFQPLLLSYYDLTPMIKRCLLYCVTFPKDHIIDKKILIELWMSQGLLGSVGNKENKMIDIGELYFSNLVMRSFFQNYEEDEVGNLALFKMHDIVHDFLQYLTKNECLIVEFKDEEERIELPANNKLGHLTIMFANSGPFPLSLDHCQRLRTITTFYCSITSLSRKLILQLKCVRTLNLSGNHIEEVPDEVGVLVHLRYLDLSWNKRLQKLPDSLCNLVNLQTLRVAFTFVKKLPEAIGKLTSLQHLDAQGCECLKKLPDSLCNLVNLQTLRVDWCDRFEKLPEAMGKLTSLQHLHAQYIEDLKLPKSIARLKSLRTLDLPVVIEGEGEGSGDEEGLRLSDLRDMDELQGKLEIKWRGKLKDSAASDAEKAKLVNKKHLLHLKLGFEWMESEGIQEAVLNALQPNSNLESLVIDGYGGSTLCPSWTSSLINLKSLTFQDCWVCKYVPLSVLGYLGSLETFRFEGMWMVKKVGFEYSLDHQVILFPNLKQLEFKRMWEWEEWDHHDENDATSSSPTCFMPRLSTLSIMDCPKLKTLPDFLPRKTPLLQNLIISRCPILSQSCKDRQGPEWSKISHIPNIQINEETDEEIDGETDEEIEEETE